MEHIEPGTACFLFLFTLIIHAVTMCILNEVSTVFTFYISAISGSCKGIEEKHHTAASKDGILLNPDGVIKKSSGYILMADLSDSLDVSVFK
jgi:hypothetical protein